jgi:hypothetical protein
MKNTIKENFINKMVDVTERLVEKYPKNKIIWKINRFFFSMWVDAELHLK